MSVLTRRLSATALLATTLGTTAACSSGSSSHTAASNSAKQSTTQSASGSSTPAWLINGKVDITKLGVNDTSAACDALLGSAQQAAYLAKVDANGQSLTNLSQYSWMNDNIFTLNRSVGKNTVADYKKLVCQINDDYGPSITLVEYNDARQGNFTLNSDPVFGYGPTKVTYVGRAAIFSDFGFTSSDKTTMYNDSDLVQRPNTLGIPGQDSYVTKDQYIAYYKKNNAETAAVSGPLIDRAAQHVYGG